LKATTGSNPVVSTKIKNKLEKIRYISKLLLLLYYKNNKKTKRENKTLIYITMRTNFKHTSFSKSFKWFSHKFGCMSMSFSDITLNS